MSIEHISAKQILKVLMQIHIYVWLKYCYLNNNWYHTAWMIIHTRLFSPRDSLFDKFTHNKYFWLIKLQVWITMIFILTHFGVHIISFLLHVVNAAAAGANLPPACSHFTLGDCAFPPPDGEVLNPEEKCMWSSGDESFAHCQAFCSHQWPSANYVIWERETTYCFCCIEHFKYYVATCQTVGGPPTPEINNCWASNQPCDVSNIMPNNIHVPFEMLYYYTL